MTTTTTAETTTTTLYRSRSEAERWRLVREFETSFKGARVIPTAPPAGFHEGEPALSSSDSRSWFQRRGSGTTYGDGDDDNKTIGATYTETHQSKQAARFMSKHNTFSRKIADNFSETQSATSIIPTPLRTRSSRRFLPKKDLSSKALVQVSKRRPVEYDLTSFAMEQSNTDLMRSPSPAALAERKSSFFGRTLFAAHGPDTSVHKNFSLGGFEPIIPQQSMHLPRQKSTMFVRNNKMSTTRAPQQLNNKPETSLAAPPLMNRSSSIFSKLFQRKRHIKRVDAPPVMTLPSTTYGDETDNKTESEGSYEYDEEIAMASTSSGFDFPLPETLLSEQQKSSRIVEANDYDKDHRNPVDRWSPSPIPELTPETQKQKHLTSFTNAPKRPIRQSSVKHDFDQGHVDGISGVKSNLLQERHELMQQMKRVDTLLQGLIQEDDQNISTYQAESKVAEASEMIAMQQQHQPIVLSQSHGHVDVLDDGSEDDDSTYSMLSGIMASWIAERDAASIKSSCKSASSTKARMSVRFDCIHVREYERVVGDNPSCSSGPPISIGWNFLPAEAFPIDEYETRRGGAGRTRREFYLPPSKRTDLLLQDWNCRPEDIRRARRDATYIQYCREKSGSMAGKSSKVTEAAFLRKANRKLVKNHPDVSDDTLEPPGVPTRPGSPFCDSPPMSLPIQPSRQPSIGKLLVVNDDEM